MSVVESFKKTIAFFDEIHKEGIIKDYALFGGLALSSWVRPRTTKDVDLIVALSKKITWSQVISIIETRLQRKVAVQKGTQRTHIKEKLSFVIGQIEVDVIGTKGFDLAAEAVRHAVIAEIFNKKIKVVNPEYLILLKLLPSGGQDVLDIKALVKKADMDRLMSIAGKYYLSTKLMSVISEEKSCK